MFALGFYKTALDKDRKVFVYRNIRKSKDKHTYSVKGPKGIEQHTSQLSLLNPEIKVSQKGMERVRAEGVKNVHAGIKGNIAEVDPNQFEWKPITYDPKKYESFVYRDSKKPVDKPDAIMMTPQGVVAGFKKIAYNMDHNNQGLEFRTSDTTELPNVGPGGMAPKGIPTYQPTEAKGSDNAKKKKMSDQEATQFVMGKMGAALSDSSSSDIASGTVDQLKWTSSSDDTPENQGREERTSKESYKKYMKAKRSK